MNVLVLGLACALSVLPRSADPVWIEEGFEDYGGRRGFAGLTPVWPCERGYQNAHISLAEHREPGLASLCEKRNELTRHVRVFDKTNSVFGTDEHLLRLTFDLKTEQWQKDRRVTYRICEILNSDTGDRIALGPAYPNNFFQVFDGLRWRDLTNSLLRTREWTSFEIVIKSDTLHVTLQSGQDRSSEEIPRANRCGFGVAAIGSGKKNVDSESHIDNFRVVGGIRMFAPAAEAGETILSPEEKTLIQQINETSRLVFLGRKRLGDLEEVLERTLASDGAASGIGNPNRALSWVYETIGATIADQSIYTFTSEERLKSVHYEAIATCPDGWGADVAVSSLAEFLHGQKRMNGLLNIAADFYGTRAGAQAARLLFESPSPESSGAGFHSIKDAIAQVSGTSVPDEVVGSVLGRKKGCVDDLRRIGHALPALDTPSRLGLLRRYGRNLLNERKWDCLPQLAESVSSADKASSSVVRGILFRGRMEAGDLWGALAAVSDHPLGREKVSLLSELGATHEFPQVQRILGELVARAVATGYLPRPLQTVTSEADAPEMFLWERIAISAEEAALPRVATAAYQRLVRSARCMAADGSVLGDEFGIHDVSPQQLAMFWKGQFHAAAGRLGEADRLFEELVGATSPAFRAQAAFDLARVRQRQHRPECASRPAAICESLLPASSTVRDLQESVARHLDRLRGTEQLYEEVGRAWAQARTAQDPKVAVAALMSAAELELKLGVPERAADALEGLVAKYPEVSELPAALSELARIYEQELRLQDRSDALRERLAREFPDYLTDHKAGS